MTAYSGTINTAGRLGEIGRQTIASGSYALTGALVNADTVTWDNVFPNGKFKVISFRYWSPELDTNASPTMTFTIGDETDPDGYLTTINGGLPATAPTNGSQLNYMGNGALLNTTTAGRDVVFTVTAAVATGASSGTLFWEAVIEGVG